VGFKDGENYFGELVRSNKIRAISIPALFVLCFKELSARSTYNEQTALEYCRELHAQKGTEKNNNFVYRSYNHAKMNYCQTHLLYITYFILTTCFDPIWPS